MAKLVGSIIVVFVSAAAIQAASPDLSAIKPRGGQRGTQVVVEFQGARLGDAEEIVAHEPGISIVDFDPSNTVVKATFQIAADCPLGEHALRVRTASGVSQLRTFWVGALPIVDEKEPNNEFAKPQLIPMNCTVHGSVVPEDVDYFAVECKKGQRLTVELEAMRLGGALFDAHISIIDAKRFELATVDDTALTAQDPCCSIIVPADGTYTIRVRESAYGGNAGDFYRMHIGTMPRPMGVYPNGGRPGEELEVTFLGDPLGPVKRKIKLPATKPTGRFGLWFDDGQGVSPSPVAFRVTDLASHAEVEPNDGAGQATPGDAPCAFFGIIDKPKDHDHFRFKAKKGQVYDIHTLARQLGSPLDPYVWVAQADGRFLAGNDDEGQGRPDSFLRFTAPDDKDYVIGIRDHLFQGGPLFTYRIEVSPIQATTSLGFQGIELPPSQERLTVTVPRGNRMAAMMYTRRIDWGGGLSLRFSDLPVGVAAQFDPVTPGMSLVPVVFEAAADAPVAARLADVAATPADSRQTFPSKYDQPIALVVGNNQTSYYNYSPPKMTIAVAEQVPFKLSIIEPKAPLVRSGTMQLKIVAERTGDFKAPIRVQPLYNPSGVSAPTEVVIPEGQNEVMLPLTANGGAALGKHKYVVTGVADLGGPVRVASPMAVVEVAVPFVALALERTNVEQGKQGTLRGKVAIATPFTGSAKLTLVGLPPKVTAPVIEITAESKEVSFALTADPTTPPGPIRNLFCSVQLVHAGEPVLHSAGSSEVRVDVPLKPKGEPVKTAAATPVPAAKPTDKPLSRLEQLRKDQDEKAKGGAKP